MPDAAYCRQCNEFVWLMPDGQCGQGHPRSSLHKVYECAAVSGAPVPPMPPPPKAHMLTVKSNEEYAIRPSRTFVHPSLSHFGVVAGVVAFVVLARLLLG